MKRFIPAIVSGLLLALSWPAYGFPFLLFIAFVPLLLVEHDITVKKEKFSDWKIFGLSYLAFFLWNWGATQWLHFAQNPDGSHSWMAFLFPLFVNSLLMSFVFTFFHFVKRKTGTRFGIIFFPTLWICFEKFHLTWEMSWPWLNLGNAFANYPETIQWYEITGTMGGTLWVLTANLIFFYYLRAYQVTHNKTYIWKSLCYNLAIIGIPLAISLLRYQSYHEKASEKIEVVLAQPALDPYADKYRLDGTVILQELLQTVDKEITPATQFVVAPETAFPGNGFVMVNNLENDIYITQIKQWLKNYPQLSLVSGGSLAEYFTQQQTPTARYLKQYNQWIDLYNSAVQVNLNDPVQYYNKSKLVVGVEHFPYAAVLKPILGEYMMNFGGSMESLGVQDHPTIFTNSKNRLKAAPIICYESIYGEYVGEFVKNGANALFIMTNDSWWSDSQGHKQLLAYARLRAIETRRDIGRSANSGISAFINQRGDIVEKLDYGKRGALRGYINLNTSLTTYVKYGDVIARLALLLAGILLAYAISKTFLNKINKNALKRKHNIKK